VPRKVDDDCLRELRWLYDRRDLAEAKRDLAAWLAQWQATDPKLCGWVEEQIEETLTFYRLPRQHHKHPKSTNLLERLNEEIKRRTHVVRIFPNAASCLRLIRALALEMHENWLEAHRYLNMTTCASTRRRPCAWRRDGTNSPRGQRCALPTGPTTAATMIQFAEDSGHNTQRRRPPF
jgi:transposase-like protein